MVPSVDDVRRQACVGDGVAATVLVDGTVAATWTSSCTGDKAELTVQPLRRLSAADRSAVHDEGMRLLAFTSAGTGHDVRIRLPVA